MFAQPFACVTFAPTHQMLTNVRHHRVKTVRRAQTWLLNFVVIARAATQEMSAKLVEFYLTACYVLKSKIAGLKH